MGPLLAARRLLVLRDLVAWQQPDTGFGKSRLDMPGMRMDGIMMNGLV